MELRNADLDKTIPVSVVLEILEAFTKEMADRSSFMESNDWLGAGKGFAPATPEEVYANVQDRVYELGEAIRSEVPL